MMGTSWGVAAATLPRGRPILGAVLVLGLLCLPRSGAAATGRPAQPALRVAVLQASAEQFPVVRLLVTVDKADGTSVLGLSRGDFSLAEGRLSVPDIETTSRFPTSGRVAVVLAVDCSWSMRGRPLREARTAVDQFARELGQDDSCGVVGFAGRPEVLSPLTTNKRAAAARLSRVYGSGETALYDAVRASVDMVAANHAARRAVVVLTDGHDSASLSTLEACSAAARRAGVPIYAVALGPADRVPLQAIADQTQGALYAAHDAGQLRAIYQTMAQGLRNVYTISYVSPSPRGDDPWRTVQVTARLDDAVAHDARQYVVPPRGAGPSLGGERLGRWGVAVGCGLLAADVVLLGVVLARRRRRASRRAAR